MEDFFLFARRYMHFLNLYTVYRDLRTGHYVPTINMAEGEYPQMSATLMFMLYAYFYSLVDHDAKSLNAFRIWRARFPEEEPSIAAVEAQVEPMLDDLKCFRNRLGFHGSRSHAHEPAGFDVFANHTRTDILTAIDNFKRLGAVLFAKEMAQTKAANQNV